MLFRKNLPQNNRRLARALLNAVANNDWSKCNTVMLDSYNNTFYSECSCTIHTKIDSDNYYYIMSVYEIPD